MNTSMLTKPPISVAWYLIRVAPGGHRMAKAVNEAIEERIGETLVERECRERGVAVFTPSFWTVVRHQRTNRLIEKRFPLFPGYSFVQVPGMGFDPIKQFSYVSHFMRGGGHHGLASFTDREMVMLYAADMEKRDLHQTMKRNGEADVREHRRRDINRKIGLIFPKGRRKKMPLRMMASAAINGLPPKTREYCRALLKELDLLEKQEEGCTKNDITLESAA
ncbi:transcription antitermination factor NusG [Rhizobium sp. BK212]|uniref:transcription termination/antitermination NusG family protein n=1 Tax=Rhizobium sp. BK212 TaxID=2587074 RepID=UPI001615F6A5|nr:transcription termination/antitermination NusG family protein [Rhizobium sp. BK212]MBB4215572.1 transcription antitermination factor NusG [Rhizobium sp. BK212]